jgi:ceramide glucosyltransferase
VFWKVYDYITAVAVASQLFFLLQTFRNYRYAIKKAFTRRCHQPPALLTVPCKGLDSKFEKNITSFFNLDYDNYILHFVVADATDAAHEKLCKLRDRLSSSSKAGKVEILIAGNATGCSQKIHNLLHSCSNCPDEIEIFAFADSDACISGEWLRHLVYPLRLKNKGASTGYRWFVPDKNNLASLALSAINAKVAQLLGNTHFNQVWGGSMAIRKDTFYRIGIDKIWKTAISDDLSLSNAVKKAGMRIAFAPACLVASYENTTWPKLFEFITRQFIITRITMVRTWWFALFSSIYSLAGLWVGGAIAICAGLAGKDGLLPYSAVPIVFFTGQLIRAILRQKMMLKLLPDDAVGIKRAAPADIFGNCLWSWVLFGCIFTSALRRTITWRGIRYKLISPTETIILNDRKEKPTAVADPQ